MIRVECAQGSPEWFAARRGIPTASCFDKIVTGTGQASKQADAYYWKLLAEWLSGDVEDQYQSGWMVRGFMLQPDAVSFYELHRDVTIEQVGFCYLDERQLFGASPDGLVGDDGGVEIKCPSGGVHLRCLMSGEIPTEYVPQVQGNLWITGRSWWDFVTYHPEMPSEVIRVARDEEYITALAKGIGAFVQKLVDGRATLEDRGFSWNATPKPMREAAAFTETE